MALNQAEKLSDGDKKTVIDGIVKEPLGGAHSDYDAAAQALKDAVVEAFSELSELSSEQLVEERYQKFARMGSVG